MEVNKVEELEKQLNKKDKEIELLKKQLENKEKLFDTTNIETLLDNLKPNIVKQREYLIKNNKHTKVQVKSLFHAYQDSKLLDVAQKVKKIPLLGNTLLFIKQKLLNWN